MSSYPYLEENNNLIHDFFQNVNRSGISTDFIATALIISKWDKNKTGKTVEELASEKMVQALRRTNAFFCFSIGSKFGKKVIKEEGKQPEKFKTLESDWNYKEYSLTIIAWLCGVVNSSKKNKHTINSKGHVNNNSIIEDKKTIKKTEDGFKLAKKIFKLLKYIVPYI